MVNIIAPDKEQTEIFAQRECNDYNPAHFAENSNQIVPGDWAIKKYITQYMCEIGSTYFSFNGMINPSERLLIKKEGIYRVKDSEKPLISVKTDKAAQITPKQIIDELSTEKAQNIASTYCLISGNINDIIDQTLLGAGFKRNEEKTKFLYKESEIILTEELEKIRKLERAIGMPNITGLRAKGKTGGGKIIFSFPLFAEDKTQVGLINKTVACLRLDQYLEEEIEKREGIPRLGQQYL